MELDNTDNTLLLDFVRKVYSNCNSIIFNKILYQYDYIAFNLITHVEF